jgi:uncharacterized protein (DUF2267 family)
MQARNFYRIVAKASGRADGELARRATAAVFHALRDRLTPEEADQAAAQLAPELRRVWQSGPAPVRQPVKMTRDEFYERVRGEAGLDSRRDARWVTLAVFGALKEALSPGEAEDVLAQLPARLKEVWTEAQAEV